MMTLASDSDSVEQRSEAAMSADSTNTPYAETLGRFTTTHWSVVLQAGQPDATGYRQALETLCRTYWYPLYTYLRWRGYGTQDVEDYTQSFFAALLEKHRLEQADPTQGRFRSFLLVSLKHFIADERDRAEAKKRGRDRQSLPLHMEDAERRYVLQEAESLDPRELMRHRRGLAKQYRLPGTPRHKPFRWFCDGEHTGANEIIWRLNEEAQFGCDPLTVETTTIRDMPTPGVSSARRSRGPRAAPGFSA
jgi:DNA-directed RNA polymerase specialized sigma24 family protein